MASHRQRIRVLIADDNRLVRKGLRAQLEASAGIHVVGEVANGIDAVRVALAERVDVVLMDLQMPGQTGLAATRELTRARSSPAVAVVVMTAFARDQYVTEALDAGAAGYLLKSHDSDQLLAAVRGAARGDAMVSPRMTRPLVREFVRRGAAPVTDDLIGSLTPAERRVTALLSSGVTRSADIARRLHVSVTTVRSHLQSALRKTGLHDRTQLALWGVRNGLHRPPRLMRFDELLIDDAEPGEQPTSPE
ncbi:response regulator transcription factor [Microbacterium sp. cf332]|uniref:response regulator transcription factor n=1 Tax=Microbacterium sp. cf332 TaxID=1761804 RepID=UPI00088A1795|nr:response regulator transcription factor [Microbacterium sp. cf332]SDQ56250.1 DNA-binding response regulator, NarL/FixJ family, contains REC and HTH domains [Microbacterium sp. cf332]